MFFVEATLFCRAHPFLFLGRVFFYGQRHQTPGSFLVLGRDAGCDSRCECWPLLVYVFSSAWPCALRSIFLIPVEPRGIGWGGNLCGFPCFLQKVERGAGQSRGTIVALFFVWGGWAFCFRGCFLFGLGNHPVGRCDGKRTLASLVFQGVICSYSCKGSFLGYLH